MKIGIDLDGIVVDTYNKVIEYYNNKYNRRYSIKNFPSHTKVASYLHEFFNFDQNNSKDIWFSDMNQVFEDASCVSNSIETIKKLTKNNKIYYISSRPNLPGVFETTINWLKSHNAPFIESLIINQPSKIEIANELDIDYFIEDAPHHIESLSNAGIKVIILETPYNINYDFLNTFRMRTWDEIYEFISNEKLKLNN